MNYDGNDAGSGLPWAIAARGNPAMTNGAGMAGPGEGDEPENPLHPLMLQIVQHMMAAKMGHRKVPPRYGGPDAGIGVPRGGAPAGSDARVAVMRHLIELLGGARGAHDEPSVPWTPRGRY